MLPNECPPEAEPWTTYFENALLLGCYLAHFFFTSQNAPSFAEDKDPLGNMPSRYNRTFLLVL